MTDIDQRNETHLCTDGEVVRVHTTCDPFLGTVDNPALAIFRFGSGSPNTSNIGSSKCLRNSKGDNLTISYGRAYRGDELPSDQRKPLPRPWTSMVPWQS
jgi:hypothetical protein